MAGITGLRAPAPLTPPGFAPPRATPERLQLAADIADNRHPAGQKYEGMRFADGQKGPLDGDYASDGVPLSDCSGFVTSVLADAGVLEPRILNWYGTWHYQDDTYMVHQQRANYVPPHWLNDLQVGDLILMQGADSNATPTSPGHIGIYVGNGRMAHCGGNGKETINLLDRPDVIEIKRFPQ